ncbi:MAG: nucleotide exchange factor GrpE [Alphaproteobacteria bacterium]|nr:nucleotide exchange factor GrpE [Alphaproteobacteria bacterium]
MSNEHDAPEHTQEDAEVVDLHSESEDPTTEESLDPQAALQAELDATTARLRKVSSAYKQLQDDMKAFKDRQQRQLALREEIIKGDAVSRLFEPLENLRRTIDAMRRSGTEDSILEGVEMVYRNFLDGFHAMGLTEIGVEGEPFNPDYHEALTMMPVPDARMDGRVVQVFDHGYRVGTRTIRPARVVIGQHVETAGEA